MRFLGSILGFERERFCPPFTKRLSAVLSVGHVLFQGFSAVWNSASWTTGPWTWRMGTGCVTRLLTRCHWETSPKTQTSDIWFWYRLMASDEKDIILRQNYSHLFWGETNTNLSSSNSAEEIQGCLRWLNLKYYFLCHLSEKSRSQTCVSPLDLWSVYDFSHSVQCMATVFNIFYYSKKKKYNLLTSSEMLTLCVPLPSDFRQE